MKFSAIDAEDGSPNFTSELYRVKIDDGLRMREAIFAIDANGDATFISLVQFIKNTIGAVPEKIRYFDEESDLVTIGSDGELQEALRISRLQGNELKIVVQVPSGGSSMSESSQNATACRASDSSVAVQTLSFTLVDDEGFPADFNPKDTRGASAPSSMEASASGGQMDVSQQPPPWFINYMEHFKDDVTTTITRKIMKRLQHSFSSSEERGSRAGRKADMICGSGRTRRKTESDTESPQPTVNATIEEDQHTMGRRSSLDLVCSVDCTGLAKSFEKLQITPSENRQDTEASNSDNMNAKFLLDETYPDGSKLPPGHRFTKGWWMQNVGECAWNSNTKLLCSWKTEFVFPEDPSMFVPHLQPGEQGLVTMEHVSPNQPGKYESYWRLAHDGVPFGDRVWCSIVVCDPDEPDEVVTVCEEVVFNGVQDIILVQEPSSGENERMIRAEEEDGPSDTQHGRFISQTATPNNTPLVGSPMKSPEVQYTRIPANVDPVPVIDFNDKTIIEEVHVVDVDGSSVDSISGSLDSDSEFVVVPLPSCFNVDIPLDIDQDDNNNLSGRLDDKSASSRSSVELLGHEEGTPDHLSDLQPEWSHYDDHSYVSVMRTVVDGASGDDGENGLFSSLPPMLPDVDIPDLDLTRDYSNDGATGSESSSPDANNNSSYILDGQVAAASSPSVELLDMVFQSDDDTDRNLEGVSQQPDLLGPVVMQPVVSSSLTHNVLPQRPQSSQTVSGRSTEDSSTSSRIVHILPEGLLSATASVFNSAKTAFSALQWVPVSSSESYSPDEDWNNISQPGSASRRSEVPQHPAGGAAPVAADDIEILQTQLFSMGFCDRVKNAGLLEKYNNFVERVIEELLKDDDQNWFVHRH